MTKENLALHLKYRPEDFDDYAGNEATVDSMLSVISREKGRPQAYLFTGPAGTGKTTLARILMKKFGVAPFDLKELNAADTNGVDDIRKISSDISMSPLAGPARGFILDEAHMLTTQAQNALLKTLEEPPSHAVFAICTTDPQKLLKTITSRCTMYRTELLSDKRMTKLIRDICAKEGINDYPDDIIKEIVRVAEGSPRNALKILDQVIDIADDAKAIKAVQDFKTDEATVEDICKIMVSANRKWSQMQPLLLAFTGDPEGCRRAILAWLTNTALRDDPARACALIDIFAEPYFNVGKAGLIRDCYYGCDPDK